MQVQKYGRTTKYTTGTVAHLGAYVSVTFPNNGSIGFDCRATSNEHRWRFWKFVWTMDNEFVGLIFAGSSSASLIIPAQTIIERMGIEIVTQ